MINERTLGAHIVWTVAGFVLGMVAYLVLLYAGWDKAALLCGGLAFGWAVRGVPFVVIEYRDAKKYPRYQGDDR
jgi:hypothetical protein